MAVAWSAVTYRVIGVPVDMIDRAGADDSDAAQALDAMVAISLQRRPPLGEARAMVLAAICAFGLSALATAALLFGSEFALGLLLLAAPLVVVAILGHRAATDIAARDLQGQALAQALQHLRRRILAVSVLAIFATAVIGGLQTLSRF